MRRLHLIPILTLSFGLLAIPAMAHDPEAAWTEHQQAHEEYRQADQAAQDAARYEWHARRDAQRGDYQGAEEAHQRAHEAVDDARHHYRHGQHYNAQAHHAFGEGC